MPFWFWPAFELVTCLVVWFGLIRPALKSYHYTSGILDELDRGTHTVFGRLKLMLKGMGAAVVAMIGAVLAGMPQLLDHLTGVKWSAFFDPATVSKITAGIMILITVLHVYAMKNAAAIEPKKSDAG